MFGKHPDIRQEENNTQHEKTAKTKSNIGLSSHSFHVKVITLNVRKMPSISDGDVVLENTNYCKSQISSFFLLNVYVQRTG